MAFGTARWGAVCQPALSSPSTMMRSRPALASRANSASSAAKNGLETPFDTYQKVSPEMLWSRRWRDVTIVAGSNAMERPMAQQLDDLSRSLTPLDQDSTIIAVIEMSQASWLVAGIVPGIERHPLKKLEPSKADLLRLLM